MLYYYSLASPVQFILAKLIFNIFLLLIMTLISILFFFVFLGFPVVNPAIFMVISVLGGISLSLVFTLMSAIAAKAQHNASLIAILGFPVILPLLLLLMRLSKLAFAEVFKEGAVWQLTGIIIGLDALVVTLAIILFPFLWKD